MSESSSLDSSEQLRSAASFRAQRPARVLGKTDLSWTLAAPPPPAVEPAPAAPPDADEIARQEALAREAREAELARVAREAELARVAQEIERTERERQAALAAEPAQRERDGDTDEDRRLWDEALARESSLDESEAARRRARIVIRDIAEAQRVDAASEAEPKPSRMTSVLRALGFRPDED